MRDTNDRPLSPYTLRAVAYMLQKSDGELVWKEVECFFRSWEEASEAAKRMAEWDKETYVVLPLYAKILIGESN